MIPAPLPMYPRRTDPPPARDHGPHTLRVMKGAIVGIFGDDVFIELGPRMQGVISLRQFAEPPKIGDEREFTLRGQEEGLWSLALREKDPLVTWETMEAGSLVQARAIRLAPGGVELKIGPLHAFMPKSQTGFARDETPETLVGKNLTVEVIEVDRERQRCVVSRKIVQQRERESERQRQVGTLKPGQVVQGRVTRIEDYGAFVSFGRGMEGLVHVSNLSHARVEHPSAVVKEGDVLDLKVLYIKQSGKRIALGLKQMGASPWTELERSHYVDQIIEGTVTRLVEYGAFIAIRAGIEGLLHRSHAGLLPDQTLRSILAPGQLVSVRIEDFDCERERMSLSLLHRNGARIAPEEAENARTFAEVARLDPREHLEVKLGDLLMEALGGSISATDQPGVPSGPLPPT